MTSACPQRRGYVTVVARVGQLLQNDIWISYLPELKTLAHGNTSEASLQNLCAQVVEVCDFLLELGTFPSFERADSEEALLPYPYREKIVLDIPT